MTTTFDALGGDPKAGEPATAGDLRASLVAALGDLNDQEIIAGCRKRFEKYLADPASLAPLTTLPFVRKRIESPKKPVTVQNSQPYGQPRPDSIGMVLK